MEFRLHIGEPDEVDASTAEVLRTFARAARNEPADADYDYIIGEALLRAGRIGEAAERCRDAVRLDRLNPDYPLALGRALWRLGRFEEAEPALREAVRLRPDGTALNAHGATLLRLNRLAEAERVLQEAVRADPGLADAYGNLGAARWELGRRRDAIAVFRQACRKAPSDGETHRNLGIALLAADEGEAAVEAFRAAAACAAEDAGAQLDLAQALAQSGRGDEAGAALAEATLLDPGAIASRPAAQEARDRLRERELSEPVEPGRTGSLAAALVHAAGFVAHAGSRLGGARRIAANALLAVPVLAIALAGWRLGPPWFRHHLLSDDIAAVARSPVEDDIGVRDRLAHAVNERQMGSVLDPQRCTVDTHGGWRRITCAYAVPVELLPGWTYRLEFSINVEQPFVVSHSAPPY